MFNPIRTQQQIQMHNSLIVIALMCLANIFMAFATCSK
nr:MAG TPA: putative DMT superfamily protein [Caudoviricetes sp.]DAK94872.1 MAG TPA: putative DMT superfamily protein [Caudoviricetes sp.]